MKLVHLFRIVEALWIEDLTRFVRRSCRGPLPRADPLKEFLDLINTFEWMDKPDSRMAERPNGWKYEYPDGRMTCSGWVEREYPWQITVSLSECAGAAAVYIWRGAAGTCPYINSAPAISHSPINSAEAGEPATPDSRQF
ncbi:hypothetical protein EVAR_59179_1 [Eumeta japonica]|uniref:Uncharacterized protein n=1 Tax=Eumeta variegata TaxID=151549 RepID=A0A4C1ZIL0_EUMVA|nr:hypothetical protein EVAR_59179_1 [Eumeta japonica]